MRSSHGALSLVVCHIVSHACASSSNGDSNSAQKRLNGSDALRFITEEIEA